MTPAARLTYLAAILIGMSLGAFLRYKLTVNALASLEELRYMTDPNELSEFSQMQYRHADLEHAQAALLSYASFLEQMEKLKPDKQREIQLAMAYTRLAMLEDTAKNQQQSRTYMLSAAANYKASGGQEYSDSEMKARLQEFDRRMEEVRRRIQEDRTSR